MNPELIGRFLDRAEQALRFSNGNRHQSETSFLQQLMSELGVQAHPPGLSPAWLFRSVLGNRSSIDYAQDVLEVLAVPSQRLQDALRPGDWMLRFVPGTGDLGHVSVLASDDLLTQPMLASNGIAAESRQAGYYGLIIEAGAIPHSRREPFARRFLDSRGRVPAHTVILRPQLEVSDPSEEYRPPAFHAADFTIANEGEDLSDRVIHVYLDDLAHPLASSKAILRKVKETYARIGITVTVELGSFTVEKFAERLDKIQITILSPNVDVEDEKAIRDTLTNLGNKSASAVRETVSSLRRNNAGFSAGYPSDPSLSKAIFVKEITPQMRNQFMRSFSLMYSNPAEAAEALDVYFYADTIIHELGHTFGINGHTGDTGNYMYAPPAGQPQYDRLTDVVGRPGARQLVNNLSKWGTWVRNELSNSERSFTQDQVRIMRTTLERFISPSAVTRTVEAASDSADEYTVAHSAADGETGVSVSEDAPAAISPFPPRAFADPLAATDQKLKDAFKAAIATVKGHSAYAGLPNVDALPIIVVALNDDGTRPFAGAHVNDMFYSGSLLKIAAMYGAFQLRHAVNALAATLDPAKVKDTNAFFRAVHNAFDARILNASDLIKTNPTTGNRVPRYEDIFNASRNASGAWSVHFHDDADSKLDFDGHLQKMVVFSHNPSAGYVIQKLGFSWINGLLQKAGLFRPAARNGIWLAGDYLNPRKMINKEHDNQVAHDKDPTKPAGDPDSVEEFNLGISGWATVDIPSVNDNDVKQVTTCIDVARLFVLLFDSKLVDNYLGSTMDLSNGDMSSLLHLAVESTGAPGIDNAPSLIGRVPLTAFSITWSKIGVGDFKPVNGGQKVFSEAMLIHETVGKHRNFVVVWQNAKLASHLELPRIRDIIQNTMSGYNP